MTVGRKCRFNACLKYRGLKRLDELDARNFEYKCQISLVQLSLLRACVSWIKYRIFASQYLSLLTVQHARSFNREVLARL